MITISFVCQRQLFLLGLLILVTSCSSNTRTRRSDITQPAVAAEQPATAMLVKTNSSSPIKPKLYLEHSGSMFGYDGSTVNGNFRNTIVALINTFPNPESVRISIVNDKVYPYPKSYTELIKSANLFQSKVGNAAYTDFGQLFKTITTDLKENEVAMLTTDLIYSDKGTGNQPATRVATTAQSLAHLALTTYAKDGALLVWQLESEFSGLYYPFNQPNDGKLYRGNRPVYVLFFASNDTMKRLLIDPAYAALRDTTRYPGYKNAMLFSSGMQNQTPFYTIDEFDPEAKGSFDKDRDGHNGNQNSSNAIHIIKNIKPPRRATDRLTLCVAITMPFASDPALLDPNSYDIESLQDGFRLKGVKQAQGRADGATHRLLLEATQPGGGSERTVQIRLKRDFPPKWVVASTSADDTRPNAKTNFARQTFALQALLAGIHNAYDIYAPDKKYYFTCSLYLKN